MRKLDEALISLIAAGEVVERPASVVKELLENALDAGASRISVELEEAGKRSIAVSDDGGGMGPEDALLAIERHATSKLASAADLEAIETLGFRGEALAAIAAVARLELTTAARGAVGGVQVRAGPGEPAAAKAAGRGPGTTVVARDLFFATPARRKFLRSDAAELRRMLDVVVETSLARPGVAFEVSSGGRRLLRLPGAATLAARIADLWGAEYAAGLLPVAAVAGARRLTGLVQRPASSARGRRRQLLYVNGRPVQDRALLQAALRGYASTLPPGVLPHLFLFLELPAGAVDVNVHPAKREVRFREADALFGFVQAAVREALGGLRSAGELRAGAVLRRVPAAADAESAAVAWPAGHPARGGSREGAAAYRLPGEDQLGLFLNARLRGAGAAGGEDDSALHADGSRPPRLWQLHDTFILAQTRTGLAIIDQHSAHERVLYEALLAAFEREQAASQELVFPRTYVLGPAEWSAWEESRGLFERLGFRIEPFGERALALHAVPALGPGFHPEASFLELLGDLAAPSSGDASRHRRLASALACRGAIRAGQRLGLEEMDRLFNDLFATGLPTADVHGRPAVIQIGLDDLARRFERA